MPSLYRNSPNVNQDFVSLKENKKKRVKSYQDFTKIRIYIRILLHLASNAFAIIFIALDFSRITWRAVGWASKTLELWVEFFLIQNLNKMSPEF
jgi:hypothetical protein